MTAIKHTLQRDIFLPCDETLISVVHVTKTGKRRKASFLCAAVTIEKPVQAIIYQVKKADRGDVYKKKPQSWPLRQLRQFDGRIAEKATADFDMHFDKVYKWTASSIPERNSFIQSIFKLCQRYLVQKPEFINIPASLLEEVSLKAEANAAKGGQGEELSVGPESDWHALSQREEADLELLMAGCETAVSNAEAFAEQLSKDLNFLDGENVHAIMESENKVDALMAMIDKSLKEVDKVEDLMDYYEQKLQGVKELMDEMTVKDSMIQICNQNYQRLQNELDKLVSQLDLDPLQEQQLSKGDLSSPQKVQECTAAVKSLYRCTTASVHPALAKMTAVEEQRQKCQRLQVSFSKILSRHMNNLFIHQGNEISSTLGRYGFELKLPVHAAVHRDLLPYADLMLWLRQVDLDSFTKLTKVYSGNLSKLYERELRDLFQAAQQKLQVAGIESDDVARTPPSNSAQSIAKSADVVKSPSAHSFGAEPTTNLSISPADAALAAIRKKFDKMLEHILCELEPVCLAEQEFCIKFFHLLRDDETEPTQEKVSTNVSQQQQRLSAMQTLNESDSASSPSALPEKKVKESLRKMMNELFPSLLNELEAHIQFQEKFDSFNSLPMLVRFSQHVMKAEDTGSFLSITLGTCLHKVKSTCFDKYIQGQVSSMQEWKTAKKGKVGILPFVHSFGEFARQADIVFRNSSRRVDIEKAFVLLLSTMFVEISRIASENAKVPRDVVLFALLSQLKISALETHRKEAKQKYQDFLNAYVTACLGRPMEKLSIFFEGIEACISAGVKAEEVGYQLDYSKQELRRIIKEYPSKEVKKGLEQLYRKVEKHLCEEENLLQVVWHGLQDEFLKQYKHFDEMIAKCYPGSGINLEFTISDILGFFSDIAQSH